MRKNIEAATVQITTFTGVQENLSRSVPVTKFLYPHDSLSSPARTAFNIPTID